MKNGKIIRIISNLYTVNVDGKNIPCKARGKFRKDKITPLVGDFCEIDEENQYIMKIQERKNFLIRPSIANVDIALIVTSMKKPDFSTNLLDKLISIISLHKIEPMICFTKIDLLNAKEYQEFQTIRDYYTSLGYGVFTNEELADIKQFLNNKIIVVTGQTGAGKSTLLNRLDNTLKLKTSPISEALNRGVHTTRHTEIYEIANFYIADTPGFSALDLKDFNKEDIRSTFKEFSKYPCQFKDCNHIKEKNCGVKEAVSEGKILESRYNSYQNFLKEVNQ